MGSNLQFQRWPGARPEGGSRPSSPKPTMDVVRPAISSSGGRLPPEVQNIAEQRFGHDFSDVRVHHGRAAEASAQQLGAEAYTVGQNIVLGPGAYEPYSRTGQQLLLHELVHVVQQASALPSTNLAVSESSSPEESEASRLTSGSMSDSPVQISEISHYQHVSRQRSIHPDPDCDDLLVRITARILELYIRADDLIRDPLKLPRSGPMSVEGHQQQFRNKQVNLRSMLNQWDTNNCGDGYVPSNAWEWATRKVPSPNAQRPLRRTPLVTGGEGERIPIRVGGEEGGVEWSRPVVPPRSSSGLSTGEAAVAAGATVAGGYLIYRAVRMLPSLLPPLWWTIPGNAAIP